MAFSFTKKHPIIWTFLCALVLFFPQWFSAVWFLFDDRPPFRVLANRLGAVDFSFSPYWITVPIGVSMFLVLWYQLHQLRDAKRTQDFKAGLRDISEDRVHAKSPVDLTSISWKKYECDRYLGIQIMNTGIRAIADLSISASGFEEWSNTQRNFIEFSAQARPPPVVVRRVKHLEGSNEWSEFVRIVYRDLTGPCVVAEGDPPSVAFPFSRPGIYRIQIRFLSQSRGRDEVVLVDWQNGKKPVFYENPS